MFGLEYLAVRIAENYNESAMEMLGLSSKAITFSIVMGVLELIAMWVIFTKADEPGIACIIPFYNMYVLFKIIYGNGWKFLLMFIPVLNAIILIGYNYRLAKVFGKSTAFAVANVFVPSIFTLLIAFDSRSSYQGAYYGFL